MYRWTGGGVGCVAGDMNKRIQFEVEYIQILHFQLPHLDFLHDHSRVLTCIQNFVFVGSSRSAARAPEVNL